MKRSEFRNKIKILLSLAIIVVISSSCGIKKYPAYSIGKVTWIEKHYNKGSSYFIAKYEYKVGNNMYKSETGIGEVSYGFFKPDYPTTIVGDMYKVAYNSKKPQRAKMLFEYPIFSNTESFKAEPGKVDQVNTKKEIVSFSYTVMGKDFYNYNHVPIDTLKKYPSIQKGAQFEVKVSTRNHYMAFMCFDKPLK